MPEDNRRNSLVPTPVSTFMADLSAGQVEAKIAHALSLVALGVTEHGRQGEVIIKLRLNRIGDEGRQVAVRHQIAYTQPTLRGKKAEDFETQTQMYANKGGNLSLFPEAQADLFEGMKGHQPNTIKEQ